MRIILKRVVSFFILICFVSILSLPVRSADFKRETVYQIITDRFYNGNTANDNPSQSSGLFDATQIKLAYVLGRRFAGHPSQR